MLERLKQTALLALERNPLTLDFSAQTYATLDKSFHQRM